MGFFQLRRNRCTNGQPGRYLRSPWSRLPNVQAVLWK